MYLAITEVKSETEERDVCDDVSAKRRRHSGVSSLAFSGLWCAHVPLRLFMFNNEPLSFLPPSRLLSSLLLCFSPFLPLVRGDAPSQEAVRSRGSEPAWVAETPGLRPALPRAASRQSPRRRPEMTRAWVYLVQ